MLISVYAQISVLMLVLYAQNADALHIALVL